MNFTREPITETIITPKEGCKLVIRNSKGVGQEEYFVDSVEIVSFGPALFFRSLERPKCFLVPVTDYEVMEVRETRMVLKNAPVERGGIKIGGGREQRPSREPEEAKREETQPSEEGFIPEGARGEGRKRDRRRSRRRRGRDDREEVIAPDVTTPMLQEQEEVSMVGDVTDPRQDPESAEPGPPVFSSLLPPPPMLISETIATYRGHPHYKKAFFDHEEDEEGKSPQGEFPESEASLPPLVEEEGGLDPATHLEEPKEP